MLKSIIAFAASALMYVVPASASTYAVFDNFDAGVANFNSTVVGTGNTPSAFVLPTGSNGAYTDFTISRPNGGGVFVSAPYQLSGSFPNRTTSGGVIDISPNGPNSDPRSNSLLYKDSGVTFTFGNAINALGFEVGDWATCCQPSNLWIQFGNSSPIQVGASTTFGDQFLTNGGAGVFVGAFDNSSTFNTVSFWGDGVGEFLVMGGTVRFANIGAGTPLPSAVPEPATWGMMLAGFGMMGSAMRYRRRNVKVAYA